MGRRFKALTVELVLATTALAGCSTTASSSGAIQDDVTASAPSSPSPAASTGAPAVVQETGPAEATAGASCADGGVCQVGDTGPGSGIVFYVASAPFNAPGTACGTKCLHLEAQTSDLEKTS
jgi:predicted small secreted protein